MSFSEIESILNKVSEWSLHALANARNSELKLRVRKMFEQPFHPATPVAESAQALTLAQRLMQQHCLKEAIMLQEQVKKRRRFVCCFVTLNEPACTISPSQT